MICILTIIKLTLEITLLVMKIVVHIKQKNNRPK
jgi:hypothetical protein